MRLLRSDMIATLQEDFILMAKAKGITPQDVTVVILDRPRHAGLIKAVRAAGARIHLITDGDVAGAIMAAREGTGVDLMLGIGGTPEGVVAACALSMRRLGRMARSIGSDHSRRSPRLQA